MKRLVIAALALLAVSSAADARCKLFKGRLRYAAHRAVDAPFKAAAGVKAAVKGPAKAAPCADGKCPPKK